MVDVFISYRHGDAASVGPMVEALRAAGLSVWIDEQAIDDFESIQQRIETGLQQAKVLVAWYSIRYPESMACQWELTTAFIAGQQEGDPRQRVLVVNPEPGNDHIHPIELRDGRFRAGSADADVNRATAEAVARHAATLPAALGQISFRARPPWHGATGSGSNRFVGRMRELWAIHSGLRGPTVPVIQSGTSRALVWLTGMAGVGKSLAAEMYGIRFGAAYPGGIFWLNAYGHDAEHPLTSPERDRLRDDQLIDFSLRLGLQTTGLSPSEARDRLGRKLDEQGSFLWVVDDLPSALSESEARTWLAPGRLGSTLVTTRGGASAWAGTTVAMESLDRASAFSLLTTRRTPGDPEERAAAEALASELGGHPLAIELAAAAVHTRGFAGFRASLQSPARDALDFAAALVEAQGGQLPHREQSNLNLSVTLCLSIDPLPKPAKEVLRLAGLLAPTPIPRDVMVDVFRTVQEANDQDPEDVIDLAMAKVLSESLARETSPEHWLVHRLVTRTVRLRHPDAEGESRLRQGAVRALDTVLDDRVQDARHHAALSDAVSHARALLSTAMTGSGSLDRYDGRLLDGIYVYDVVRGNYLEARHIADRLVDYATHVVGSEHEVTLGFRSYIGRVLREQGDLAAALTEQETLYEIRRRVLGTAHQDTLTSLSEIGVTLYKLGHLARARALHEEVLHARLAQVPQDPLAIAAAMHNLAMTLCDLGERQRALELQAHVVRVRQERLGDTHPETVAAMANLGQMQWAAGDVARAREVQELTLSLTASGPEGDHPERLADMNNLAATLDAQGKVAQAKALLERCLDGRTRALGPAHPDTLITMNNLGAVLIGIGEYERAGALLEQSLDHCRRALGPVHPLTFQAAYHLYLAIARNEKGSPRRLREVLGQDLKPLLDQDPTTLSPELLDIRVRVARAIDSA